MDNVDVCSVCNVQREVCRVSKMTYTSSSLQTCLANHLGPGVYSPVCTECFGLIDLIEYLQVQLKLKISELKTVFSSAIKKAQLTSASLRRSLKVQCDYCQKSVSAKAYKLHLVKCPKSQAVNRESIEKPVHKLPTCDVCEKSFVKLNDLNNHKRVHTGEKPFQCDNCGATFNQKQNLTTHIRTTHLQEKRYSCELCDKKFTRQRLLDCHINSKHKLIKPYKCPHCEARFSYPHRAKVHAQSNCRAIRVLCAHCDKYFKQEQPHNCRVSETGSSSVKTSEESIVSIEVKQQPLTASNQSLLPLKEYSNKILVCRETGTRILFRPDNRKDLEGSSFESNLEDLQESNLQVLQETNLQDLQESNVQDLQKTDLQESNLQDLQGTNLEIIHLDNSEIQMDSMDGTEIVLQPSENSVREILIQEDSIAVVEEEVTSSRPEMDPTGPEVDSGDLSRGLQNEFEVENAVFSIVQE